MDGSSSQTQVLVLANKACTTNSYIYVYSKVQSKSIVYSYNTCLTCNYGPAINSAHSLDSYVGYGQAFRYIANHKYPVPEQGLAT